MADGKINSCHARKIGRIETPLATWQIGHRLPKNRGQHIHHRIKNRNGGNAFAAAGFFNARPQILINDTHQQNARVTVKTLEKRL